MGKLPVKKVNVAKVATQVKRAESVAVKPLRGVLYLIKIWEQIGEKFITFGDGEIGLKNWLRQNSEAIQPNGGINFAELSFTYSNDKLPMVQVVGEGETVRIIKLADAQLDVKSENLCYPNLGVKLESEYSTIDTANLTQLTIITINSAKYVGKTTLSDNELEAFIQNGTVTVQGVNPNDVVGLYGVTPNGPTVVSGKWRIRRWRIEVQSESGNWTPMWP